MWRARRSTCQAATCTHDQAGATTVATPPSKETSTIARTLTDSAIYLSPPPPSPPCQMARRTRHPANPRPYILPGHKHSDPVIVLSLAVVFVLSVISLHLFTKLIRSLTK